MHSLGFSNSSVLVVGDVILDKYHFGKVRRISPEAPVPVVEVERSMFTLGGAGNVANNIAHLGGKSYLFGTAGNDTNKTILLDLLNKINVEVFLCETNIPTTTKVRVIGEHQQIVRLDFEEVQEIQGDSYRWIRESIDTVIGKVGAVVISDYGKGVCSPELCRYVIDRGNSRGIFIVVDPKGKDWTKYTGATVVSPNVKELSEVVGRELPNINQEIEACGAEVMKRYDLKYLLVTRSEKGMTLISHDGVAHIPTEAKEVFDVSGAGDTVVATLSAAVATGIDIKLGVELANRAAGIVVSKIGTTPIKIEELVNSTKVELHGKIVDFDLLLGIVKELKERGEDIVFTNGCFDILHAGHVSYLKEAKRLGDILIVGLNSDDSVKRLKGHGRPLNRERNRAEVLEALEFVDYIVVFDEDTPYRLVKSVMPKVLVKGGDYTVDEIVGREFAGKTVVLPFVEGYSTTNIIKNLRRNVSEESSEDK